MPLVPVPETPTEDEVWEWIGNSTKLATAENVRTLLYESAVQRQLEVLTLLKDQAAAVTADPPEVYVMPVPVREALMRRVARAVASKEYPLGQRIGGEEFMGSVTINRWDAEIEDRESDYRQWGIA